MTLLMSSRMSVLPAQVVRCLVQRQLLRTPLGAVRAQKAARQKQESPGEWLRGAFVDGPRAGAWMHIRPGRSVCVRRASAPCAAVAQSRRATNLKPGANPNAKRPRIRFKRIAPPS
jgi:hypothetical protein